MKLEGKVALVTGAARNVGKGVSLGFLREGARVFMNDIDSDALNLLAEQWRKDGYQATPLPGDISDPATISAVVQGILDDYGRLDILVNNAVVHPGRGERGPFLTVTGIGWREFMARNLDALFILTQRAARAMAKRRCGSIISISSNGAVQAHRQRIAYDSLKGALEAFTRAIAVDLAPWGVRANAIRPIAVRETPPPGSDEEALTRRLGAMVPMGRIASPGDVAALAAFLASDDSEFITGQVINVDGGMLEQSRPPQLELESVALPENLDI